MPEFEVTCGRDGRGLVRDGRRVFLVPAALARELARAGDEAPRRWREVVGGAGGRRPPSPLWLRVVLVPAAMVDRVARCLSPLAGTIPLMSLAAVGGVGLAAGLRHGVGPPPASASALATGAGLFVVTALWHEFGHAAALRREGLTAGGVGAGLLWVVPVLTCDVTASVLLPRRGRVRVDVAGMVFQFAAAGVLAAAAQAWPPAGHGAAGALAAVAWNAIPLLRTDSHWLLLDLLGLPDLDASPPAAWPQRRARLAGLALWRLATVAALVAVLAWLPWRVDAWVARLGGSGWPLPAVTAARILTWFVAAAGGWRAACRAWVLARAVVRDLSLTPPGV